jgi:hypothetical protein
MELEGAEGELLEVLDEARLFRLRDDIRPIFEAYYVGGRCPEKAELVGLRSGVHSTTPWNHVIWHGRA